MFNVYCSMNRLRRFLIIGILTSVFVSACGGNSSQQTNSQTNDISAEAVRVVNHIMGQTKVPINPQRVVILDGAWDTVLSLGVKPIGIVQIHSSGSSYLKNRLKEIKTVGHRDSPNLESIVALEPDLILGTENDRDIYKLLSQIAPTVLTELETSGDWKKMLNKYAEALGKADKAEQIMTDYQARIDEFQAQIGDRLQQTKVSIVNVRQDRIQIYLEDSFSGTIVADAGLPRPPEQAKAETQFGMKIGKEQLYLADGDIIFVWTSGSGSNKKALTEARTALKQLKADPLWSKLNAVQQDKVYEVPGYWIGMGPIAANLVLDDLFEYLVEQS